jgi:hypothetical protein
LAYLDFDTLLICNNCFDEESVKFTFDFFKDVGIRKFIFTYEFDRDVKPMSFAIQKFKTLKPYLKSLAPRGVRIYTAFNVIMSDGVVFDTSFNRLTMGHSDRVFIDLPFYNYENWLESDMNHLLYKNKLKPALTSFERNFDILECRPMLDRFIAIKNAVFCMDINYITSIHATDDLKKLILHGTNIFPCISNHPFNYPGIIKSFNMLQDRIGNPNYAKLCNIFYNSSKSIMEDATFYPRKD